MCGVTSSLITQRDGAHIDVDAFPPTYNSGCEVGFFLIVDLFKTFRFTFIAYPVTAGKHNRLFRTTAIIFIHENRRNIKLVEFCCHISFLVPLPTVVLILVSDVFYTNLPFPNTLLLLQQPLHFQLGPSVLA